jgi:hypothetical protein
VQLPNGYHAKDADEEEEEERDDSLPAPPPAPYSGAPASPRCESQLSRRHSMSARPCSDGPSASGQTVVKHGSTMGCRVEGGGRDPLTHWYTQSRRMGRGALDPARERGEAFYPAQKRGRKPLNPSDPEQAGRLRASAAAAAAAPTLRPRPRISCQWGSTAGRWRNCPAATTVPRARQRDACPAQVTLCARQSLPPRPC